MPGVMHYLQQGDEVIRGLAILLLAMSLLTWCLALGKAWGLHSAQRHASRSTEGFWAASSSAEGLAAIDRLDKEGLFAPLALAAVAAADDSAWGIEASGEARSRYATNHDTATPQMRLATPPLGARAPRGERILKALRRALSQSQRRLEAGQTLLATIASVSPFVGLLGTVWGIYHALIGIAASGQPSIADIAGPVGEALIMTAFGLAVAIPAVVAYNLLGRRVRTVSDELDGFARDLHAFFAEDGDGIRQV